MRYIKVNNIKFKMDYLEEEKKNPPFAVRCFFFQV
jgi:hypothetical protein